jgi:hypothetical protein
LISIEGTPLTPPLNNPANHRWCSTEDKDGLAYTSGMCTLTLHIVFTPRETGTQDMISSYVARLGSPPISQVPNPNKPTTRFRWGPILQLPWLVTWLRRFAAANCFAHFGRLSSLHLAAFSSIPSCGWISHLAIATSHRTMHSLMFTRNNFYARLNVRLGLNSYENDIF